MCQNVLVISRLKQAEEIENALLKEIQKLKEESMHKETADTEAKENLKPKEQVKEKEMLKDGIKELPEKVAKIKLKNTESLD